MSVPVLLLAPAAAFAVGAGAWLCLRPQRALLVLAALVPFDGLLLLIPHPAPVEAWKEALVLGAVGGAVVAGRRRQGRRPPLPAWVLPLGALVALALLTTLWAGSRSLFGMKVGFFYALVAAVLWRCPFTGRDRDRLVTILMTTAVVTSVVGLGQRVAGPERLVELGYEYNSAVRFAGDQLRAFSTFNQPFPFAFFLMVTALVCIPVALADRDRWRNRLFLLATPLLAAALLATVVRAALVAGALGALWLLARSGRSLVRLALPVAVLAVAGIVLIGAGGAFLSSDSMGERLAAWGVIVGDVADAPLGKGIGTSGAAAERAGAELVVGENATVIGTGGDAAIQADNYYLKVLVELGPVGVWLFLTFLVLVVLDGRRVADAQRSRPGAQLDAALADGITAAALAASAAAMVSSYWEIFPVDVLFWLLQGVLLSVRTGLPEWSATPSLFAPAAAGSRPTSESSSPASARPVTSMSWRSSRRTRPTPSPPG